MGEVHAGYALAASSIPGDAIPLCWQAEAQQRGGDEEDWLNALDVEAIREADDDEPGSYTLSRQGETVTCRECVEWARA